MRRVCLLLLLALLLIPAAHAEEIDGDVLFTLQNASGEVLTMRGGRMYVGDEYISEDNQFYRIISVDDAAMIATAEHLGSATADPAAAEAFASLIARAASKKKIAMYSTHSDESYVPTDGTSSKVKNAGIFDVGEALKENLEKKGIEVTYSDDTFYPHDAGAYRRSRRTAEELLKDAPDALFDIHRDAIPASHYETEVKGEDTSKVRLFVGRSNPNGAENKAFAQELKAVADKQYPGLVKDIFIGKGNYNQELYPRALLLEMGTHEIEKEKAISSTEYLSNVITEVLYGETAKAETTKAGRAKGASTGIFWVIGVAVVAAIVYALASSGRFKDVWPKIKRSSSEITGGLVGDKPEKKKK